MNGADFANEVAKALVVRANHSLVTRGEGDVRPGPWWLPITGGWLDADIGSSYNWWQRGYDAMGYSPSAMVEACISAYAQTVAMCPGNHWWTDPNKKGGKERQTTSALSRVLRRPNTYQTASDFFLNAVRQLYSEGNAYALGLRNNRNEIFELHLMNSRQSRAHTVYEEGQLTRSIFYSLGGNDVIDNTMDMTSVLVPARDVLHLRLQTPRSTLVGESPIVAAMRDIAATDAILSQQITFYLNQARPASVLSTDLVLDAEQVQALRDRWNEQSKGLAAGGTPILTAGLKPVTLSTNSVDAQLADVMKLNEQHIALAFRVPLPILGLGNQGVGNTEELMRSWIGSSLGFCLNHIETSFDALYGLRGEPEEYTELDTQALLRSSMKERIESFARGVQTGIYAPNEARADFGLAAVPYGDEPRTQAQVVPLSAATGIPSAPSAPAAPTPSKDVAAAAPKDQTDVSKQWARQFFATADSIDRRRSAAS